MASPDPIPGGSPLGQSATAGKSASELDALIKQSEEAIERLQLLEKSGGRAAGGGGVFSRIGGHFRRHGSNLVNIGLAASVLVVAIGRLGQKYEFQAAKEELEAQRAQLERKLAAAEASGASLATAVEQAVEAGGRGMPAALREVVAEWRRQRGAGSSSGGAAAAAAGPPAAQQQQKEQDQEQQQPPKPKAGIMV